MKLLITFTFLTAVFADVTHLSDVTHLQPPHTSHSPSTTTPPPPPHPYAFSYTAGRYKGHVDRQHTEEGDGTGVVRGIFQYVDPRNQVRTVEYVADEFGFHPALSHPLENTPRDTEAVQLKKQKHFELYEKIAREHKEHADSVGQNQQEIYVPNDTKAVSQAKQKHLTLFDKIAEEHYRIGLEHEKLRQEFEATSIKPIEEENNEHGNNEQHYDSRYHN